MFEDDAAELVDSNACNRWFIAAIASAASRNCCLNSAFCCCIDSKVAIDEAPAWINVHSNEMHFEGKQSEVAVTLRTALDLRLLLPCSGFMLIPFLSHRDVPTMITSSGI